MGWQAARAFLRAGGPNPTNRSTTVEFGFEAPARVKLGIYDVAGRLVRALAQGGLPAGVHRRDWDGRDEQGRAVAKGIYVVKLNAGGKLMTRKLVVTK